MFVQKAQDGEQRLHAAQAGEAVSLATVDFGDVFHAMLREQFVQLLRFAYGYSRIGVAVQNECWRHAAADLWDEEIGNATKGFHYCAYSGILGRQRHGKKTTERYAHDGD